MKSKLILFFIFLVFFRAYSYKLLNSWLATPGSHTVYLTSEVNSLAASWGLNFSNCISVVNGHGVTNAPTLIAAGTTSEIEDCIVRYETVYLPPDSLGITKVDTSSIAVCTRTDFGEYDSFTITINDSIRNVVFGTGVGEIDINSVMMHELTHSLGLNDIVDNTALMHGYYTGITNLTNDEINGIKAVYEKPRVRVVSPHTFKNDRVIVFKSVDTVDIEFEVRTPNMLEHNSITPPDLIPVGFFTDSEDSYSGYDATFNSLGNDTYRYKTNMDAFIEANDPDLLLKLRSFIERDSWQYLDYKNENSPDSSLVFEIKAVPKIIAPLIEDNHLIPPPDGKGAITDTIKVVVAIPQIDGAYPAIRIKIDDVYVNLMDIVFEDNLWVYYWDLEGESSEITGKRFKIEAELFDDPSCSDESGAFIVEALLFEDFEEFSGAGWGVYYFEYPDIVDYYGWYLYPDPLVADNTIMASITQNSLSSEYRLVSPAIAIPDTLDLETTLDFQVYFERLDMPHNQSYFYFYVLDNEYNTLYYSGELSPVRDAWTDFNYDLTEFKGQTIRLMWDNYYDTALQTCDDTIFALDSILVYVTPPLDMDLPVIDYITGTQANINEDMNINLAFNDFSGIVSVTADYEIEGESGTTILAPAKGSYNYTGTLSARDHECYGDIVFRVEDEIGNTTISDIYDISWTDATQELTTPSNLIITTENDSTVTLSWGVVQGASEYKVYASEDPYGTFTIDTLGTFISGTQWQKNIDTNKKFYYIVAGNTSKKPIDWKNIKYEKLEIGKNLIFIDSRK